MRIASRTSNDSSSVPQPSTPPGFSVSPIQGRMERRGGEPSLFDIEVKADGQTGEKVGYLCIVLPDDDEQFTIKVTVNCF